MSIPAIGDVAGLSGLSGLADLAGTNATAGTATQATDGSSFAGVLSSGLENLQSTQATADQLGVQAATGDLTDVHDYVIAATKAELTTELTVTMRNKALDAFNEIMRMQG